MPLVELQYVQDDYCCRALGEKTAGLDKRVEMGEVR